MVVAVAEVVRRAVEAAKVAVHPVTVVVVGKEVAAAGLAARATHLAVAVAMRLPATVAKANRFGNAVWPN
jgi:hypothetical protein